MTGVTRVRPSYIIRRASLPGRRIPRTTRCARRDPRRPHRAQTCGSAKLGWRSSALLVLLAVLRLARCRLSRGGCWRRLVALAVLIQRHDRVVRAREATARAMAFYERGLARIEDRWIGNAARQATVSPTTVISTRTTSTCSAVDRCSSCWHCAHAGRRRCARGMAESASRARPRSANVSRRSPS